jgi:hypothetical protein
MGKAIKSRFSLQTFIFVLLLFPLTWCTVPTSATAEEEAEGAAGGGEKYSFHLGGYVRTWASINLQDRPETNNRLIRDPATGRLIYDDTNADYNDRYKFSMLRGSLKLDLDAKTGPFTWKVIGRADQELRSDYLTHLQEINQTGFNNFGSNNMQDSPGTEIMDQYNQGEFREYYVEFDPIQRVKLRLGRQQVVWGETDFFRAMDVIHGYDYRWRLFIEPENEELRKPLILANAMIQVPEVGGSLQAIFRPGALNRPSWTGNTYPLEGGRWNPQPAHAWDVLGPAKYNYDYPDGDTDDATWGARWSGIAGPISYSLIYLKTFNNDPVLNPGLKEFAFENQETTGLAGDLVFPKIDVAGVTASGYAPWLDAVLSTEVVYTFREAFNKGGSATPMNKYDSLGSNIGPPLLGKAVANALGSISPSALAIETLPYDQDPDRTLFPGGNADAILGVVNRVLRPQGLTNYQLGHFVLPCLDAIYEGNVNNLLVSMPAQTGLRVLGPKLSSPDLQAALPVLLAAVPPEALQGNVGGLLAAMDTALPGALPALPVQTGLNILVPVLSPGLQAALAGLLPSLPPEALQGNVGQLLAAIEGVAPGTTQALFADPGVQGLLAQGASGMLLTDQGVQGLLAMIDGLLADNSGRNVDIGRNNFMNAVYNFHNLLGENDPLLVFYAGGIQGIQKKDSLMFMLRMDKNLAFTQQLLGTGKPAFFTVQAFNHIILDFNKDDDIARFLFYGEHRKEIETMLTAVLVLHYRNEAIVPTLAGGWDVSYGGFFFFPSVEFMFGDHWRLRLEADFFFPSGQKDPATDEAAWLDLRALGAGRYGLGNWGVNENSTSFLGYFANSDQFLMRLTYQF